MRAWIMMAALAVGCGGDDGTPEGADAGADGSGGIDAATQCSDPAPPPDMCDFFLGCGCDVAAGQKCTVIGTGHTCGTAGTSPAGATCVDDSDCAPGTACLTRRPTGVKMCMAFCDDAHPCPSPDFACYIVVTDGAMPTPNILATFCGEVCSVLDQDCTIAGQACYTSNRVTEMEHGECATAGTLGQGETCTRSNDCLAGFTCINPGMAMPSFCAQYCDLTDGDPACAVGTCTALQGHTQTGVCVTP